MQSVDGELALSNQYRSVATLMTRFLLGQCNFKLSSGPPAGAVINVNVNRRNYHGQGSQNTSGSR